MIVWWSSEDNAFVVDVPEPWRVVPHAALALRPGGVFVGFIPTVLQVQQLVGALRDGGFAAIEAMESLQRFWHVTARSVRPEHRMVAHSGFLVVARRLASASTAWQAAVDTGDASDRDPAPPTGDE